MTERVILLFLIIAVACEIINLVTSFNERDDAYKKGYHKGRDEGFKAGYDEGKIVMRSLMEHEMSQNKNSKIFKK